MSVLGENRKNKPFSSVISYDRGSLYERALKRNMVKRLNMEAAQEKEDREVAACSFHPNLSKSRMTQFGSQQSAEKRTFENLYHDLTRALVQKEESLKIGE